MISGPSNKSLWGEGFLLIWLRFCSKLRNASDPDIRNVKGCCIISMIKLWGQKNVSLVLNQGSGGGNKKYRNAAFKHRISDQKHLHQPTSHPFWILTAKEVARIIFTGQGDKGADLWNAHAHINKSQMLFGIGILFHTLTGLKKENLNIIIH